MCSRNSKNAHYRNETTEANSSSPSSISSDFSPNSNSSRTTATTKDTATKAVTSSRWTTATTRIGPGPRSSSSNKYERWSSDSSVSSTESGNYKLDLPISVPSLRHELTAAPRLSLHRQADAECLNHHLL
ncbi:hypothetical protein Dimus_026162 [Dionaea muscipula]